MRPGRALDLQSLADTLRAHRGLAAKADIAPVMERLAPAGFTVPLGDDCAVLPCGDEYLLLAIEGFMNEFVAADPWFAGWCAVMVNIADVAAMGGRPLAVVDAIWADGEAGAAAILDGMRAASMRFGVPIVGGHTNIRTDRGQLAAAVLGRARCLLSSFDARPGDRLVAAIDLRGRYREPFSNWEAATEAPGERLRGDLEVLPRIAEAGLARAAKDISQAGLVGTAAMLAECSAVSITIDVGSVPRPSEVPLGRWLTSFPSLGHLLAVGAKNVGAVVRMFAERDIAAAEIGVVDAGTAVAITDGETAQKIWDFAEKPLLGCAPRVDA